MMAEPLGGFGGFKEEPTKARPSAVAVAAAVVGWVAAVALAVALAFSVVSEDGGSGGSSGSDPAGTQPAYDPEWCHRFDEAAYNGTGAWVPNIDLRSSFPAWDWEHGYWVGKLSYYGADQEANESPTWPYKYDHYEGFVRICVRGSEFVQRNIFVYPPQTSEFCAAHGYNATRPAPGGGMCGVHGNEKLWEAGPLFADDCEGGMAGPYKTPYGTFFTNTTVFGARSILYNVWMPTRGEVRPDAQSILFQNQLTTFENGGASRFRTAQGFVPTKTLSFYTETKVNRTAFMAALEDARARFNVREEDQCKFDGYGLPTGRNAESCAQFFDDFFEGCDEP